MNWSDLAVVAIIFGFGIIGLTKGFIFSMFRLASFFISVVVSVKFYPVVAKALTKTPLYAGIKASILKGLLMQQRGHAPKTDKHIKQAAADTVINNLHLPDFLKGIMINNMPDQSGLLDMNRIMDVISGELAKIVIDVASLALLYIIIRIALALLKFILQGIAKLPVFKQMDRLGGFAFGMVEGLLTVYILCAVIMLFQASPQFTQVFEVIDSSVIAKFFYHNNFVVDWMFSGGMDVALLK